MSRVFCFWCQHVRVFPRDADFPLFSVFSVIFGPICSPPIHFPFSLFSPISSFSFWTFCLFLCSFSVRRHAHVDFQLFSQRSSGIRDSLLSAFMLFLAILLAWEYSSQALGLPAGVWLLTLNVLYHTTPHHPTLLHTTLHHPTLLHTTLHYSTLHHTILHTTPHYSTPHYTTPNHTTLLHTTPHNTPHHTTLLHTTPPYTTPHHTTPHHITLNHTTPHYSTPHHITLNHTTPHYSTPHSWVGDCRNFTEFP